MKDASMPPSLSLILGGARSGKSEFAEKLTLQSGLKPVYLATAATGDPEMQDRIKTHRERRGPAWTTIEEEIDLASCLKGAARPGHMVLVDCLTLWLSNLMMAGRQIEAECDQLLDILPLLHGTVVFVSSEVGLGIVPDNAAARAFRDYQGQLNQRLAQRADYVVLMSAGLPLTLKQVQTHA